MNHKLIKKIIKRIEGFPESYDQRAWFISEDNETPCGTVACLAGETVICSAPTVKQGIKLAFGNYDAIPAMAERLLGLPDTHSLFAMDGSGFPAPYAKRFGRAQTRKGRARIVVAYLREALKRDAMVW